MRGNAKRLSEEKSLESNNVLYTLYQHYTPCKKKSQEV
nr:MAG TPA: hypothetical protein [Caudoviricetes sp.]